ncbi:MAG TPA: helix-turn-helix domain-containing protein [Nannocystaceae bacterium]|nr:helix-turn-helix domain-containing protein [Nannocystaceae bacterium]
MRLVIDTYNLQAVERMLCVEALNSAGSIVDAAALLGITRHALKRRIIKHRIEWPVRQQGAGDGAPKSSMAASGA